MKKEITYHLQAKFNEDFDIVIENKSVMRRVLGYLREADLIITVSKYRKRRSDRQNRFIHGVVVPTLLSWYKETQGEVYDHDEVYLMLRTKVIGDKLKISMVDGVQVISMEGKRFSQMNTLEFTEAIDKIIKHYDERECYIPLPNEENLLTDFIK